MTQSRTHFRSFAERNFDKIQMLWNVGTNPIDFNGSDSNPTKSLEESPKTTNKLYPQLLFRI